MENVCEQNLIKFVMLAIKLKSGSNGSTPRKRGIKLYKSTPRKEAIVLEIDIEEEDQKYGLRSLGLY